MSAAHQTDSDPKDAGVLKLADRQPRHSGRRLRLLVGVILLLAVAGVVVTIRFGLWTPQEKTSPD